MKIKLSAQWVPPFLALAFELAVVSSLSGAGVALPVPPQTPPPPGNPKPAGTFSGSDARCQSSFEKLQALIPAKTVGKLKVGQGHTTQPYPTFWVYLPAQSGTVTSGEFGLYDRNERTLFRTAVPLPQKAGIVGIQLPTNPKYALREGNFYHWYFTFQCGSSNGKSSGFVVDGWVQRVSAVPGRERRSNSISPEGWYDAVTRLAILRLKSPQDAALQQEWNRLLRLGGLEELAPEPILGPVRLEKSVLEK